jgi:CO dehydrogenase/acetyl-CoA synthase alpha subunit
MIICGSLKLNFLAYAEERKKMHLHPLIYITRVDGKVTRIFYMDLVMNTLEIADIVRNQVDAIIGVHDLLAQIAVSAKFASIRCRLNLPITITRRLRTYVSVSDCDNGKWTLINSQLPREQLDKLRDELDEWIY